jgi:hypothetical protein
LETFHSRSLNRLNFRLTFGASSFGAAAQSNEKLSDSEGIPVTVAHIHAVMPGRQNVIGHRTPANPVERHTCEGSLICEPLPSMRFPLS